MPEISIVLKILLAIVAPVIISNQEITSRETAIAILKRGEVRCQATSDGIVDYIGPSDAPLLECIQSQQDHIRRIVITSNGGDALVSIQAAELLADSHPDVEVRALCASSCANYIVPVAANLVVQHGSILALHGGAENSEEFINATEEAGELSLRSQYPEPTENLVRASRASMRETAMRIIVDQERIAQRLSIQNEWFALDLFVSEGFIFKPGAFVVPGYEFTRTQIPKVNITKYWYPKTDADKENILEMMNGTTLWFN